MVELVRDIRSTVGYGSGEFKTFALDCGSEEFKALVKDEDPYDYVFLLAMKKNSDNFKESSIIDVIEALKELDKNITILIYEPLVHVSSIFDCEVVTSLERFKQQSEIILTNRLDDVLDEVKDKVFTRDIYGTN